MQPVRLSLSPNASEHSHAVVALIAPRQEARLRDGGDSVDLHRHAPAPSLMPFPGPSPALSFQSILAKFRRRKLSQNEVFDWIRAELPNDAQRAGVTKLQSALAAKNLHFQLADEHFLNDLVAGQCRDAHALPIRIDTIGEHLGVVAAFAHATKITKTERTGSRTSTASYISPDLVEHIASLPFAPPNLANFQRRFENNSLEQDDVLAFLQTRNFISTEIAQKLGQVVSRTQRTLFDTDRALVEDIVLGHIAEASGEKVRFPSLQEKTAVIGTLTLARMIARAPDANRPIIPVPDNEAIFRITQRLNLSLGQQTGIADLRRAIAPSNYKLADLDDAFLRRVQLHNAGRDSAVVRDSEELRAMRGILRLERTVSRLALISADITRTFIPAWQRAELARIPGQAST